MGSPKGPTIRPWAIFRRGLGVGNLCCEAAAVVLFMGPPALLMEQGKACFRLLESAPEALAEGPSAPDLI